MDSRSAWGKTQPQTSASAEQRATAQGSADPSAVGGRRGTDGDTDRGGDAHLGETHQRQRRPAIVGHGASALSMAFEGITRPAAGVPKNIGARIAATISTAPILALLRQR